MMLETLGETKAAKAIDGAIRKAASQDMKSMAAGKMGMSTEPGGRPDRQVRRGIGYNRAVSFQLKIRALSYRSCHSERASDRKANEILRSLRMTNEVSK